MMDLAMVRLGLSAGLWTLSRSTLAGANEARDWRIYAGFAATIQNAREAVWTARASSGQRRNGSFTPFTCVSVNRGHSQFRLRGDPLSWSVSLVSRIA